MKDGQNALIDIQESHVIDVKTGAQLILFSTGDKTGVYVEADKINDGSVKREDVFKELSELAMKYGDVKRVNAKATEFDGKTGIQL